MTDQVTGGDDAHPFVAPQEIECLIGACPGDMRLVILRADGTLLSRPFNDGPYYRCTRPGCFYHDNPRGLHEISSRWVQEEQKRAALEREYGEVVL